VPSYDYKCPSCGFVIEIIHSIKDSSQFFCEKCGSKEPLERLISFNRTGFICKGSEASAWKEKRYRVKKNADLGVKQIERYGSD